MKKRIGTLKGRPIVEGDENLVRNPEYKDTNIFDTGYYYKIIDKEAFYSIFNNFKSHFVGYSFGKDFVTKLQREVNIIYSFSSSFQSDYICILDKNTWIEEDGDGHITSVTKVDNGLQFLIDILSSFGEEGKEMSKTFKNSFIQITKSEFNKAYLEYEP